MGVSMSTLAGWVVVLALFGGFGYREWSSSQRAQLAREKTRVERQAASAQKEFKKVKQPKEKKPKESKPKQQTTQSKAPAPAKAAAAADNAGDYSSDELDADRYRDAQRNKEFARQIASIKQGTKIVGKAKAENRQKSVKQSRAEEAPTFAAVAAAADTGRVSAPSSTAGIDADDDSSSAATSPVLAATTTQAGAVDDMLEKSAPGPSVLRLTGTEEKPDYKPKHTKAPEVVETKKQRQNRRKAEQAKAEREAAEQERKVKQEAQRRTARVAEGRAAKDGSSFMAAQASQSNAWTGNGNGNGNKAASNGFIPVQPLDTFDVNAVQTDASKSSVPSYDKNEDWMSSLPSEEEQMEILRNGQQEDSWNTVTKGRKNKKSKAAATEAPAPAAPADAAPAATKAVPATAPAPVAQKQRPAAPVASGSSFAALTVDNPAEEQEEEWDV